MNKKSDPTRNLALELVRVTEAAAMAAPLLRKDLNNVCL